MRSLVLVVLALPAILAVPRNPQRIAGGSVTIINNYPEVVSLLFSWTALNYRQTCGGIIINNRSILTAAHCTFGHRPSSWRIRTGSSYANTGGFIQTTSSILNHPNYNPRTVDNDVSMIRSSHRFQFTNVIQPATIASANYFLGDNQEVWAVGWGILSQGGPAAEQLKHVQIWTVNQAVCRTRYAAVGDTITDNMLCAGWLDVGGRDQCQGDSGGPLFHNGVVVGVSSWDRGCAHPNFPGVNARVTRFSTWIAQNL